MENNNRTQAAIDLLRLKAKRQMSNGKTTCFLDENDIQEIMTVAGCPFIGESELDVIDIRREEK